MEKSVDPGQVASLKPVDLGLVFSKRDKSGFSRTKVHRNIPISLF